MHNYVTLLPQCPLPPPSVAACLLSVLCVAIIPLPLLSVRHSEYYWESVQLAGVVAIKRFSVFQSPLRGSEGGSENTQKSCLGTKLA